MRRGPELTLSSSSASARAPEAKGLIRYNNIFFSSAQRDTLQLQVTGVPRRPSLRPGNSRRPRSASVPRARRPPARRGSARRRRKLTGAGSAHRKNASASRRARPQVCLKFKIQAPHRADFDSDFDMLPEHNRNGGGGAWRAFRAASTPSGAPLFLFLLVAPGDVRFGLRGARQTRVRAIRRAREARAGRAEQAGGLSWVCSGRHSISTTGVPI